MMLKSAHSRQEALRSTLASAPWRLPSGVWVTDFPFHHRECLSLPFCASLGRCKINQEGVGWSLLQTTWNNYKAARMTDDPIVCFTEQSRFSGLCQ